MMSKQEFMYIMKFYHKYIDPDDNASAQYIPDDVELENADVKKELKKLQQIYGAQIGFNLDHNGHKDLNTMYSQAQRTYTNDSKHKKHHHSNHLVRPVINDDSNHQSKKNLRYHRMMELKEEQGMER